MVAVYLSSATAKPRREIVWHEDTRFSDEAIFGGLLWRYRFAG